MSFHSFSSSHDRVPIKLRPDVRGNLRKSTSEGACHSLMVGLAETWFGPFFIAAGLSNFAIGILATVPMLIGSLLQLATPWGIRRAGSYRIWSAVGAGLQGVCLLTMGAVCWLQLVSLPLICLLMIVYWGSGLAIGPAWNSWMEFLIPRVIRTRYLSCRMRYCQVALLIAVCVAGIMLQIRSTSELNMFFLLFLAAGVLRLMSASLLASQTEYPGWICSYLDSKVSAGKLDAFEKTAFNSVLFFVAIQFSVYISGPFFAPFMLRTMEMSYGAFMFLIVLGYLGRILTLHLAGEIARRSGPRPLLWWGAIGLIPLSGLWWFHQSFAFLAVLQLLGGVAWGFYELAMSLVFIERIPQHLRPRILARFGLLNGFAMVGGSLVGGTILQWSGNTIAGFMTIFTLSSVLRVASLTLFPHRFFASSQVASPPLPESLIPATPQVNGRPAISSFAWLDLEPSEKSDDSEHDWEENLELATRKAA